MVNTKYKEAMAEVLYVLKHCDEQVIAKIPLDVIKNLKENAVQVEGLEEKFETYHDDISILELRQETIALLAAIYRKYLCTDEERKSFDSHLISVEEILGDGIEAENIFKKEDNKSEQDKVEQQSLVLEKNKETLLSKLIKRIKSIFAK